MEQIIAFLSADIRTAAPLLIAALGLLFNSRAGIVNIGGEGVMLVGAFSGVAFSYLSGSAWLGLLMAGITGMLVGLLFAFMVITAHSDQTVVGTAINILGLALTTALTRILFGVNTAQPQIDAFSNVAIPVVSKIPVIGEVFFNQNVFVYLATLLLLLSHFVLFKTESGLRIRAVGENPRACDTLGINVYRVRYVTMLISGFLCGIAGAGISLGLLSFFTENMIAGRGYIALAAVTFGKWKPVGALWAVLLFGAGEALQYRIQAAGIDIPYEFLVMLPYLLTLLAVSGLVGRVKGPAAAGQPYIRE